MKLHMLGRILSASAMCLSLASVAKFCPEVRPGGGRIGQCLKQNEAQLSDACKERLAMVAAEVKEVKEACADDVQQFCAGVKLGEGRVAQCLKRHKEKLSTECKTEIADLLEQK